MSSKSIIKVDNVSKNFLIFSNPIERLKQLLGFKKKYNEFRALKNIDIEIFKGETVGIIGVNGSGKSTLLQIICGTLSPSQGIVSVSGRVAALLELGAGFNPEFTGVENVKLNAELMGLSSKEIENIFDDIVNFAGIGDFINQPVKTYSSGMFARLAFSTAIHVDPEILIVDEILAVGDSRFQRKCLNKLKEIRDSGSTILFVSHDDYQVRNICDKVLYLRNGEQVFFGNTNEGVNTYLQDLQKLDSIAKKSNDKVASKKLIEIVNPRLINSTGQEVLKIESGDSVNLEFYYECKDVTLIEKVNFVFNLYRKDNVYICGTTTQMKKVGPYPVVSKGHVSINFPSLKLLSGIYNWRVAVNDAEGIQIISEALPVCEFSVSDSFSAVGLYDIEHNWLIEAIHGKNE